MIQVLGFRREGPLKRADFQHLAEMRIREAQILLGVGEWDGAYYLAGYAVECALKSCIIRRLMTSDDWPDKTFSGECYKHDLKVLLWLADLEGPLSLTGPVDARWVVVKDWSEQSRYERGKPEADVRQFIEAITDPADGVLPWIRSRW
jgi:hypothetical protein